jgi:hypothetical protein
MIQFGDAASFDVSGVLSANDVGTYEVIITLKDKDALWADNTNAPLVLTWEITPKEVTVAFDQSKNTWPYDGNQHTATAIIGGLLDGDSCGFIYKNNTMIDAGKQNFEIIGIAKLDESGNILLDASGQPVRDSNYKLPETGLEGTMEITPIALGINWGQLTYIYEEGTKRVVKPIPTGVVGDDIVSFIYTPNPAELTNAGSLPIEITGLSGADKDNYLLPTNCEATLEIARQQIDMNDAITVKPTPVYTGDTVTGITYVSKYVTLVDGQVDGVDVGKYYATFQLTPNYTWATGDNDVKQNWEIAKATATITQPIANNRTYDGFSKPLLKDAPTANCGTIWYIVNDGQPTTTLPSATNAGKYKVYYYTDGDDNNNASDPNVYVEVEIAQATHTISTVPKLKSGLSYNGSPRSLITAGSGASGTIQYRCQKGSESWSSWSTSVPTGEDAGDYTIEYRVLASSDGNRKASGSLQLGTVTIAKANHNPTLPTAKSLTYTGTRLSLIEGGSCSTGTMTYAIGNTTFSTEIPSRTDAGVYTVNVRIDASKNYNQYKGTIEVTINRKVIDVDPMFFTSTILDGGYYDYMTGTYRVPLASIGYTRAPLKNWSKYGGQILFQTPNRGGTNIWSSIDPYIWDGSASGRGPDNLDNYFSWGANVLADSIGDYTIFIKPSPNYCWADETDIHADQTTVLIKWTVYD